MNFAKIGLLLTLLNFAGCRNATEANVVDLQMIKDEVAATPCSNSMRQKALKELFIKHGMKPTEIEAQTGSHAVNFVATVVGKSDESIVLGAHYDKVRTGCGAIDNWTGIVLLANIYGAVKNSEPPKTLKFVAFGNEEKGLLGSKAFVEEIDAANRDKICAMINFDSYGFENSWALENASNKNLIALAMQVGKARNAGFAVKNLVGTSSDSTPFNEIGIPAITLSGLDSNWRSYLHKNTDQVSAIDNQKVFEGFLFGLALLTRVEQAPCASFR
ncbi:MAG: M28 family metallopeptidase [Pyrinomonadaceae bacterium]